MADESFLRELFLQRRLPPSVTMVLASTPDSTGLDTLAELADKVIAVPTPPGIIASVASSPTITAEVEHLRTEVSRLEKLVKKLAHSPSRPASRSVSRGHSSRRPPTPTTHSASTSPDPSGQFVCPTTSLPHESSADYVTKLKEAMRRVTSSSPHHHSQRTTYVYEALKTCIHMFVGLDAVKRPLQQPYDGPNKLVDRSNKFFTLEVNGKNNTVSLDRLKPAYMDNPNPSSVSLPASHSPARSSSSSDPAPPSASSTPIKQAPPPRSTRSGRHVYWPAKFSDYVH